MKVICTRCGGTNIACEAIVNPNIKVMVENELQNRDFNIVSRMVEKVLRDKMLDNIEIIVRNKDIND